MDLDHHPNPEQLKDEQIIELYRTGRDEVFELLVQRYQQELYHFLVRFTGSRPSAEDVFQEAFLQVHVSIDRFDTSKRFKPWLFTIAANKARDHLRRSKRRSAAALSAPVAGGSDEEREFLDLMQADLPLPEDEADLHETQQRVRQVVQSLPDHLREILVLAYFQQFPYKRIAQMLGIPLGTVKSRLHTAVGTFADHWARQTGPSRGAPGDATE